MKIEIEIDILKELKKWSGYKYFINNYLILNIIEKIKKLLKW
jgi:hypothetical protein